MIPAVSSPGRIDWYAIYRRLMFGKGRYRRHEIERMTMTEVCLALDDDIEKPRPPSYADASGGNVQAYLERRRRMSNWEKLVAATTR